MASAQQRRCRPALGTYVEVTAEGPATDVARAIEHAYDAIAKVERLMSVHQPASELSLLNAEGRHRAIQLSPWTWQVLFAALRLAELTNGAFDPTADPTHRFHHEGDWRDVELGEARTARLRRPVRIDLGGIAKGFAVDRAVEALRRARMTHGIVNAGGDLRTFGSHGCNLHLRHPRQHNATSTPLHLSEGAWATSAPTFSRRRENGRWVSHLIEPRSGESLLAGKSVSVQAPTCLWADALTKVVWVLGEDATPLLSRFRARAWILESE